MLLHSPWSRPVWQRVLLLVVFVLPCLAVWSAGAATIANPRFNDNSGPFQFPTGWTPFGQAKFEGQWTPQSWNLFVGDIPARRRSGVYQVIDAVPGTRYRLTVNARSGHPNLQVRLGLIANRSANPDDAAWSVVHNSNNWVTLSTEATAQYDSLVVMLQVFNTHQEFLLLEGGIWDDVRIEAIGTSPTPTPAPLSPAPTLAPAHDVYANLANLWSLTAPKPGVRTFLAGTHDPSGGNADYDRYEGTIVEDGQTWLVLKSFTGPGALLRIWMTNFRPQGWIRVYIDGERVVDCNILNFFGGCGSHTTPLADKNSGAWISYVPMPFAESARVQVYQADQFRHYWQITYQQFEEAEGLRPFSNPLNATDQALWRAIQDQWGAATLNPKQELPGTGEVSGMLGIPAGGQASVWEQGGVGVIDALFIDGPLHGQAQLQGLWLDAYWDGASRPQVSAPLGLFLGVSFHRGYVRGLLMGMAPPVGGYCYFPMPFGNGARIVLRNTTGQAMSGIQWKVRWAPLQEVGPLRFHTVMHAENPAGRNQIYVPFDLEGRGHWVGLNQGMTALGGSDHFHFLEGDEYIWVDGEQEPSTAGTGTEDYFNCGWYFQNGAITVPAYGAPHVDHQAQSVSAYRLHVPDWVPFDESFRFGLEVGNGPQTFEAGDYRTVGYFYLESGSSHKRGQASLLTR